MDIENDIDCPLSDHFPLISLIKVTLAQTEKLETPKVKRYNKPKPLEWENYNEQVKELYNNSKELNDFIEAIQKGAEETLTEVDQEIKKPYIAQATWDEIQERNDVLKNKGRKEDIKKLNKEIKKMAHKDRKEHLLDQFNENPNDKNKKQLWQSVKNLKGKFTHKFVKMKNKEGQLVSIENRAEAIADYLEQCHWTNSEPEEEPDTNPIIRGNEGEISEDFSTDELNSAIKSSKHGKQPGPDLIIMELIKWLNQENRYSLLEMINKWWNERKAPKEIFEARVVPIHKKGPTDEAANYSTLR